jgi:hypothetical protein
MSDFPQAEFEKLLRIADEMDLGNVEKLSRVREVLTRKKNQWYVVTVRLKHTEREDGDYGDVYYRLWTAGECAEVLGNPLYQKSNRVIIEQGQPRGVELTTEEISKLHEFRCDIVSRALHKNQGLTKQVLVDNWAFVNFMFSFLGERSGMGQALAQDFDEFFRDRRGSELRVPVVRADEADAKPGG